MFAPRRPTQPLLPAADATDRYVAPGVETGLSPASSVIGVMESVVATSTEPTCSTVPGAALPAALPGEPVLSPVSDADCGTRAVAPRSRSAEWTSIGVCTGAATRGAFAATAACGLAGACRACTAG